MSIVGVKIVVTSQIEKNTQISEDMLEIKQFPKIAVSDNEITEHLTYKMKMKIKSEKIVS